MSRYLRVYISFERVGTYAYTFRLKTVYFKRRELKKNSYMKTMVIICECKCMCMYCILGLSMRVY